MSVIQTSIDGTLEDLFNNSNALSVVVGDAAALSVGSQTSLVTASNWLNTNKVGLGNSGTISGTVLISTGSSTAPIWKSFSSSDNSINITQDGNTVNFQVATTLTAGAITTALGSTAVTNATNATNSVFATNVVGGSTYSLVIQNDVNSTRFVTNGTTGQVLKANANGMPTWVDPTTLTVGAANSVAWSNVTAKPTAVANLGVVIPPQKLVGLGNTGGNTASSLTEISLGTGLTFDTNTLKLSGGNSYKVSVATTSGTWTKPSNCSKVDFILIGATGGGGWGSTAYWWTPETDTGTAGGAGAVGIVTITNPLSSYTYTIGSGGTTGANDGGGYGSSGQVGGNSFIYGVGYPSNPVLVVYGSQGGLSGYWNANAMGQPQNGIVGSNPPSIVGTTHTYSSATVPNKTTAYANTNADKVNLAWQLATAIVSGDSRMYMTPINGGTTNKGGMGGIQSTPGQTGANAILYIVEWY